MLNRIAVALAVVAFACNSNHAEKPDAAPPDAPPHPDASIADEPQLPTGTPLAIPLATIQGLAYTGRLGFGTQHQAVILDTGSSTLGVAAATCTNCGVTPLYMPGTGAVDQHQTASSMFADGSGWSGEIYQDAVTLGTMPVASVKFAAITSSNNFFRSFDGTGTIDYQGILGLGPDGALLQGTTSYLSTEISGGMFGEMAFQLCPDGGTMWMGGYDASKQAAPQAVTPMSHSGLPFYAVQVADMAVAGAGLGQNTSAFGPTIIDTGTSIAFIPTAPLTALTNAIEASPGFQSAFAGQSLANNGCVMTTMTASQIDATLPPLSIAYPGVTSGQSPFVDLPATHSYLIFMGNNEWCFAFGDSAMLTGGAFKVSLFGDSLLASYITTFDVADQRMGFAPETGCHQANIAQLAPAARPVVHPPGVPWWQHDPRVRYPSPAEVQRRFAPNR
jgi:hypothetical protein